HRFRQYRFQTNHLTSLYQPCPSLASIHHCSSRKLPRNRPGPTVFPKICGSSFSFVSQPNRSSKAPGARQKCKGDLRGVEAVDVRRIHHRATHNLSASSQLVWIS
ncbi:ZWICHEL kinesin-like calmodulin-binding protein, partial [Prunus dulcis]